MIGSRNIWRLDRQTLIWPFIASVLYALVTWATNVIVAPGLPSLRPGSVIPILSGVLFGPIAGFVVGVAGRAVADILTFGLFWNWDISNGFTGLVAGLTPLMCAGVQRGWRWAGAATVLGALGVIMGSGFAALTDIWVANLQPDLAISTEWLPVAQWDLALGLPLTVGVLIAWQRLQRRAQQL